ncbi:delta-aminolevulinic acid dehydratase [Methanoculleus chikugoensis]|uniref:Delta-aminolevulinic acid dehydratase n=2 Tax=Methanoculleus chikugoensis TaxID=118126 RepID=A0ABM7H544_9EURY|nr:delta-aminolevulinic acid dehydratase [Methanoculleus chikugoensis]
MRRRIVQPLLRETELRKTDLIAPVFVDESISAPLPIASMPGQFRHPVDGVAGYCERLRDAGIRAVLLFGVPAAKDGKATGAYAADGVVQRAVQKVKEHLPEMVVVTDVCACEYTDHGHCGFVGETVDGPDLLNDPSLELMAQIAVSHAESGADIVAPSCMLDGMVRAIRQALDAAGFQDVLIMSYSSKFASALYGPFRDAADSGFSFGDRTTYQINPGNAREALMESELDAAEGADILMVKPAGAYLDILAAVANLGLPVAAYQVSGEYAMIKAAAERGWLDERAVAIETLTAIRRAGADLIITYFAEDAARWLDEEQ